MLRLVLRLGSEETLILLICYDVTPGNPILGPPRGEGLAFRLASWDLLTVSPVPVRHSASDDGGSRSCVAAAGKRT